MGTVGEPVECAVREKAEFSNAWSSFQLADSANHMQNKGDFASLPIPIGSVAGELGWALLLEGETAFAHVFRAPGEALVQLLHRGDVFE